MHRRTGRRVLTMENLPPVLGDRQRSPPEASSMKRKMGEYSNYVQHPRYESGPRFTDLQPRDVPPGYRLATYISKNKISGTAIEANLERQAFSPVPVLYYFDLKRDCVECAQPFLFFAEEQKYWCETLGFALDADCIRCTDCRNRQHGLERQRRRYEELFHGDRRTIDENLEMAECSLALLEDGAFHRRQTERVRMLLNNLPDDRDETAERRYNDIQRRPLRIENEQSGEPSNARERR